MWLRDVVLGLIFDVSGRHARANSARKSLPSSSAMGTHRRVANETSAADGSTTREESEFDYQVASYRNQRQAAPRGDPILLVLRVHARGALLRILR